VRNLVEKTPDRESGARRPYIQAIGAPDKDLLAYISCYINGYGRPRTSSDLDPRIRPDLGQNRRKPRDGACDYGSNGQRPRSLGNQCAVPQLEATHRWTL
jgi:hypothetical protein